MATTSIMIAFRHVQHNQRMSAMLEWNCCWVRKAVQVKVKVTIMLKTMHMCGMLHVDN